MPLPPLTASLVHLPALPDVLNVTFRVASGVALGWVCLLGLWLVASEFSYRARTSARNLRIDEGTMTIVDAIDLLRDTVDGTGAPYWPQRRIVGEALVRDDVPLLVAWIRAGQPLPRLLTYRQAGFTADHLHRHLTGDAHIDDEAAMVLAALRYPVATP